MIQPMDRQSRVPTARVVCDECGKDEVVTCDYERSSGKTWALNEGQANRKIVGQGWELVKGKHHCPACRAKRKAFIPEDYVPFAVDAPQPIEVPMAVKPKSTAVVTSLREPSREQKRQIMSLLEVSYDPDAGRYKGKDTDKTVAEAIGGGCMPGWVAELREEFFGPDGGNAEIEAVTALLTEIGSKLLDVKMVARNAATDANRAKGDMDQLERELDQIRKRMEIIKIAVGPKAGCV